MQLFQSATVKLTAWYLLIIMLISISFSVVIYGVSSAELNRHFPVRTFLNTQQRVVVNFDALEEAQAAFITERKTQLVGNLILANAVTLVVGGGASYFLARRTLQPIQDAMNAQGRFTSDASHELRTPLAAMQTEIEVALRDKTLSKPQMQALLKSNLEEVNKLRDLSDRLLQLTSEKDMPMKQISLEDAAIEAANRAISAAQAKDITIENNVGKIKLQGNADSLADVLNILIDNAIKYSSANTKITLDAKQQGRFALLSVADQGVGIKATDKEHIFDRFYRADISRTKQRVNGYGLGLSIAKRIAQLHGGSIEVESTPGKGSTFTIKLPIS